MKFFCSKDCPDGCHFEITESGKFKALPNVFDKSPFFCSKLIKFYRREIKPEECFYVDKGRKIKCDYQTAIDKMSELLKSSRNILFLRGSGSLGYKMRYWDMFFSNFDKCHFVSDNPCDETGVIAHEEDFGVCTNPDVRNLEHVDTIIIFGRNARVVNQHLYSYLKHLKKEIIYIDPIKSETAKIAKKYIRINPATDGILCNHILGSLGYIKNFLNLDETIKLTGISREDIEFLKSKIKPKKTGLITGFGLQRYSNGKNIVQWINRLAYYTDNLDTLYYGKSSSAYLSGISVNKKNKITIKEAYDRLKTGYFDLVVIVAANPLVTYPETNFLKKIFDNVNLVTIDTNLTDTVDKSNIFIKVGGMFAQDDILGSYFFDGVMNKRERFLDTISDTDVVKMLSEKFDFQIKVKSIDEINYEKKALRRNFTKDEIGISLPIMGNGLRLISNSHSLYLNSQLAEDEIAEEFLHISPDDAYKFDINDGDMVELFNEYGNLKIHAKITDKVAKGYVMVYKSKKYFGNTPNILTKMSQTDAGLAVAYYDTFVNIRRAE
ncbi:MAG: hypothetical protein JG767_572 [Deferribacteraceae bacterium]|jgi:formylmethanofuran dehydrogenase subunit B/formylmethanofuran dehydrogenase subunit D|nr:hypothetical protein [Deferribacteraceae bacterium]